MDYQSYRNAYFPHPAPRARFRFKSEFATTLYFEDFEVAAAFYEEVFSPPSYVEGNNTKGWAIASGWLTLLRGEQGNSQNSEITFELETVQDAEALQSAFIDAGARGPEPTDQLMYA